jgi:hypothetical protein
MYVRDWQRQARTDVGGLSLGLKLLQPELQVRILGLDLRQVGVVGCTQGKELRKRQGRD